MDRLIKSRILHDNGDAEYTLDTGKITVNQHGDGLMRRVLDRLWEYEKRMIRVEMTNGDRIRVMRSWQNICSMLNKEILLLIVAMTDFAILSIVATIVQQLL